MLNPNCWNIFANLVNFFNWLVGFVAVIRLSLTVWPGKQFEFRRFPCQTLKLSCIMATKSTSRMDTRLDILQCYIAQYQWNINLLFSIMFLFNPLKPISHTLLFSCRKFKCLQGVYFINVLHARCLYKSLFKAKMWLEKRLSYVKFALLKLMKLTTGVNFINVLPSQWNKVPNYVHYLFF